MLKTVLVSVAESEFTIEGKSQTDSRISLLTGVHRKDVRRLIWEQKTFKSRQEIQLHKTAQVYGLHRGIAFPIHGAHAEFAMLNLVINQSAKRPSQQKLDEMISDWALIRDYVFESSKKFTQLQNHDQPEKALLTRREIECLQLAAEGKSSWDMSVVCKCTEATINFHFSNIRKKFKVNTRQQAIVKAMQLGLIFPEGN